MSGAKRSIWNALLGAFQPAPAQDATRVSTVERDASSLLTRRGWKQSGQSYSGVYSTSLGRWSGRIERAGDRLRVLIKKPPMDLIRLHRKYPCFHQMPDEWWSIHLHTEPIDNDISAVVAYVERVIEESQLLATKRK